jgi:hypothetical protein
MGQKPDVRFCPTCGTDIIDWYDKLSGCMSITQLTEVVTHLRDIESHIPQDPPVWMVWDGPWGATHTIRTDFWHRCALIYASRGSTDNDYWRTGKFGKIYRIPGSLLEEFRAKMEGAVEKDHTILDDASIDPTV